MTSKAFGLAQLGNAFSDGALSSRNKVINGAMTIDQRNAGAAVTYGSGSTAGNYFSYNVDRFFAQSYSSSAGNGATFTVQQNAGSVTPPAGHKNYLGITVTSPQATLQTDSLYRVSHLIEGYNTADLSFGSSSAVATTLSFWARSSVTGLFSGSVNNNGVGGTVNRYIYTYTINSANTWEYKTIAIPSATTGSWGETNGYGVTVEWCLGASSNRLSTANVWGSGDQQGATGTTNLIATSGATFYLTGVQLEAGDTATPFEHRSYGQELALCQRYYEKSYSIGTPVGTATYIGASEINNTTYGNQVAYGPPLSYRVTKRVAPSVSTWDINGNSGVWMWDRSGAGGSSTFTLAGTANESIFVPRIAGIGAGWVPCYVIGHWEADAEL